MTSTRAAPIVCCLETIRVDDLTFSLLADAYRDLTEGAPRLRVEAFGITTEGRRLDVPHYSQPKGLVYLRARLTVSSEWRNCPAPIDGPDQAAALVAVVGWAEGAWYREGPHRGASFPLALPAGNP